MRRTVVLFVFALLAVAVTRIPLNPEYLWLDNVNLAYALEEFDPWNHQPHPPGYPLFVGEARAINLIFQDAWSTLLASSILASAVCLMLAMSLGRRMFSPLAGVIAASLLLFNPTFWFASLNSPLRVHLAVFSLLTGYCCWRSWNGEKSYTIWAAIALGIGSGFRPDLVFYLGPLWAISACRAARSTNSNPLLLLARGGAIIAGFLVVWTAILAWAVGGLDRFNELITSYLDAQFSETSVLFDAGAQGAFHLTRLLTWNGMSMISWIVALPLVFRRRENDATRPRTGLFILAWILPGLLAQGILHAAAPGHTLFAAPAHCLIGGAVLSAVISNTASRKKEILRWAVPAAAAAVNIFLFARSSEIGVAIARWEPGQFTLISKAVADGFFQTSLGHLQIEDQSARESIREIDKILADECDIIVSAQGSLQFFSLLNWRVASYYFPDTDIWVLSNNDVPPKATLVRGKKRLEVRLAPSVVLNVPQDHQVIWLLDPNGFLRKDLGQVISTTSARSVFRTDLRSITAPIRAGPFQFVTDQHLCASTRMD